MKTIGYSLVDLETTSDIVRSSETNAGNFLADIIKYELRA